MSADIKREPGSMIARLVLTILGALLMVTPPYAVEILNLSSRFHSRMLAGMELGSLALGFVLLFLAFRGRETSS
jgi:hypothetical protein